ncbi:MAG TPA: hypothetical protein VMD08_09210, partial [Candidatus Baltobacteraceae bacterium]|nr:hypothetical protein [Candidatus Baltobacteraceae bacterium]
MSTNTTFMLTAARLLDGSVAAPLEGGAVLLDGGRIAAVGRAADIVTPDAGRVDYGDATILPGLVDSHTHLVSPGDGTAGDDTAAEDDQILLLRAVKNLR